MNRRWTDVALTAAAPATWGSTYLVTSELLPPGRPLWSGALRALPAGLLLLALTRRRPHGDWWRRAAVLGGLNIGAFFPLLFLSAYRLPGGTAAVLAATQPLMVAALGVALLRERPARRALLAALVAPAGVTLVVLRPGAGLDPLGVAAALAGTAAMAAGLVLTRRWGRPADVSTLAVTSWQLIAGGLVITPVAVAVEGPPPVPDGPALLGYVWLALVSTALAYALWFRGAARLPVTRVSLLGALSPLTAALLGWLVLDQALSPIQLAGFAVAVTAMVVSQLPEPGRPVDDRCAGDAEHPGGTAGQPARRRRQSPATSPSAPTPSGRTPAAVLSGDAPEVAPATAPSGSAPGGSSAAAARGSVNRSAAAGPATDD